MMDAKTVARKAISLLDLTNLNEGCTSGDVIDLCKRAQTPYGNTAAVCIWKEFIKTARPILSDSSIRIATVVNFPAGGTDTRAVLGEVDAAVGDGADEIDLVFPYKAFMSGDVETCIDQISRVRDACRPPILLKVIIETGELKDEEAIYSASRLAIDCGADFIKTSTGKVAENATPRSAGIMLRAIRDSARRVGFKPAGGIRTVEDAAVYLKLADDIMGEGWATPATLRFGASSVLANLLSVLEGAGQTSTADGY